MQIYENGKPKNDCKLGQTVYFIEYCSFYSDSGYSVEKSYITKKSIIEMLGEENTIIDYDIYFNHDDKYLSVRDVYTTEKEAKENLKMLDKLI